MDSSKFHHVKELLLDSKIDFVETSSENIQEVLNSIKEQIPEYIRILIFEAVREIKENPQKSI